MSESPISLRDETGVERFRGTQSPGGGSQPFDHVVLPIAFDTPGLVIPASGPTGIALVELAVGDVILGIPATSLSASAQIQFGFVSLTTPFDGTNTALNLVASSASRGNLPGTPPTPVNNYPVNVQDEEVLDFNNAGIGVFEPLQNFGLAQNDGSAYIVKTAQTWYVYLDNSAGGDPGAMQGDGSIHLFVARAS